MKNTQNPLNIISDHHDPIIQEVIKIHGKFQEFTEADFYPEHEKRYETDQYKTVRHKMVNIDNRPCVVCGVTQAILIDSEKSKDVNYNFYQAKQIEIHHFHIEWALINAIEPQKFNALLKPNLKHLHPEEKLYQNDLTEEQIKDWVDHHPHNLMPLCDVHHRHKYWGIHHVTYPIWSPANMLKQDFIDQILEKEKNIDSAAK